MPRRQTRRGHPRPVLLSATLAMVVLVAAAVPPAPAAGQDPVIPLDTLPDAVLAAFVDGYVADAVHRSGLPGGAAVLVRDGRVVLARSYGVADYGAGRPVDVGTTLFRQASVSKTFTWLLVMQLVEEGRLDLDADVNEYLDFEIPATFDEPITLTHLMTHTPGFAERYWGIFSPASPLPELGEQLESNVPDRVYAPGTTVSYSNYGSALAAYIVERAAGAPFQRLVRERIYAPAGMERSTFAQPLPDSLVGDRALGYAPGQREPLDFFVLTAPPAGAMTATAADMGRFLTALLSDGEGVDGRIAAPGALDAMMTLHHPLGPGLSEGLGLGFMVGEHRGVRYAGHGGNLPSTATDLQMLPDHGLGWYVAFNGPGTGGAATELRSNLLRAVIDRFVAPDAPTVAARAPSTADEVAGLYLRSRRPHSGPVRLAEPLNLTEVLAREDGSLRISGVTRSDGTLRRWLPDGPDRFVEEETGAALAVTRDESGEVASFASGLVYPVAEFQPAPWLTTRAKNFFLAAFLTLLLAALAQPVGWALRKGFRAERPGASSRLTRFTRPAARAAVWLLLATTSGWLAFFSAAQRDFDVVFTARATAVTLATLSWLSVVWVGIIAVDAVAAWRDPSRGLPRRLGMPVVALAALVVCVLFFAFELTSFTTDF